MKVFQIVLFFSLSFGQVLPTIPANIFRITVQNYNRSETLVLNNQQFGMHGITRAYFDKTKKNNIGSFISTNDLYHIGASPLNEFVTIESFLANFNNIYGTSLPVFNAGYIDTSRSVISNGVLSETRKQEEIGRKIKIDYGISNDVMLSVEIPNITSFKEDYKNFADIDRIYGADDLIDYHISAKTKVDSFFQTNSFITLPTGIRDTLETIYDNLYSLNGDNSVLWVLHGKDDPFSRGFIDPRFMTPNFSAGDTANFDSLSHFYYRKNRSSSGVGDITFGVTALLKGTPSWKNIKSGVLYGRIFVSIPFGFTIEPFSSVGIKQLSQLNIGSGVSRINMGIFGEYNWNNKTNTRVYGAISSVASAPELLYTPVNIFSGAHSNPDSIISNIGETYKFKEGNWFNSLIGYDTELVKNKFLIKLESSTSIKLRDRYTSLDDDWDRWMESHDGYDSEIKKWDLCIEAWFLNSTSQERIGPFNFDIVLGYKKTFSAKNTFEGYKLYSGITTYIQGW